MAQTIGLLEKWVSTMWQFQRELREAMESGDEEVVRRQEFRHGRFDWLHYPQDVTSDEILVARVMIYPGQKWPEHIHSGYEQMLYVISGTGEHWVDGEREDLHPGRAYYLPPNVAHTMTNSGDDPLVHLSVYHPRMPKAVRELTGSMDSQWAEDALEAVELSGLVSISTMQNIQDKFAAAVGLGVITVTADGDVFTEPTDLPEYCQYIRSSCLYSGTCRAFDPATGRTAHSAEGPFLFNCCMGIVCVAVPLVAGDELMGHMACGFVSLSEPDEQRFSKVRQMAGNLDLDPPRLQEMYGKVEVVLQAQMMAAADSLASIANSILSLALRDMRRSLETEHAAEMLENMRQVSRLEHALQEAELRATEARMKPHFLFNALNLIASKVAEGGREAEDIVYSLSDFLRFSLRRREPTATVAQEMECLRNYINIQKARFGADMRFKLVVEPGLDDLVVPAMIMQPLVENSIVHGLAPSGYRGLISVAVRRRGDRLKLSVADSGAGFDEDEVLYLPSGEDEAWGQTGIGLQYVGLKLQQIFGDDFQFHIRSKSGRGSAVIVDIPAGRSETW